MNINDFIEILSDNNVRHGLMTVYDNEKYTAFFGAETYDCTYKYMIKVSNSKIQELKDCQNELELVKIETIEQFIEFVSTTVVAEIKEGLYDS